MSRRLRWLAPALLVALAGCAARQGPDGDGATGAEVGLASYYADRFHGRPTASGAPYDRAAFTCAHRTWPFGTRLRVTELERGRAVVVTVTDRGPHVAGRVVDLSAAAARALGLTAKGLARVRVERVR
jgi:rare lipoprotein A